MRVNHNHNSIGSAEEYLSTKIYQSLEKSTVNRLSHSLSLFLNESPSNRTNRINRTFSGRKGGGGGGGLDSNGKSLHRGGGMLRLKEPGPPGSTGRVFGQRRRSGRRNHRVRVYGAIRSLLHLSSRGRKDSRTRGRIRILCSRRCRGAAAQRETAMQRP